MKNLILIAGIGLGAYVLWHHHRVVVQGAPVMSTGGANTLTPGPVAAVGGGDPSSCGTCADTLGAIPLPGKGAPSLSIGSLAPAPAPIGVVNGSHTATILPIAPSAVGESFSAFEY